MRLPRSSSCCCRAHSQSTSRFVLKVPGERLGWRRNAGKLTKDSPGPKAQPNTQSHHRGQKSRWVEAAGTPVTRMTVMITINDAHSALLSSSAHPGQRSDGELDIVSALEEPRRRGRLL